MIVLEHDEELPRCPRCRGPMTYREADVWGRCNSCFGFTELSLDLVVEDEELPDDGI